jgi:hypothetical protein
MTLGMLRMTDSTSVMLSATKRLGAMGEILRFAQDDTGGGSA